jgi:hypothetical protein
MADEPTPFTLSVPDSALADLHKRLELTRFPTELAGAGHARGPPLADLTRLVARWRDGYDWRRREAQINALPMFTRPLAVEGFGTLDVHFVHKRSAVTGAIPLLFVHGCTSHRSSRGVTTNSSHRRAWPLPGGGEATSASHIPIL